MAIPYVIGLDLGQAADPTGLAVVERIPTAVGQEYAVRHLVRFPPGTSFATIAATLGEVIDKGGLPTPPIVVDITAVGPNVLPVVHRESKQNWIVPVTLTAGIKAEEVDGIWRVPKRDLVTGLQLLLQERRLKVAPGLPEAEMLVRELTSFRATVSLAPDAEFADWRTNPGDDLVLAVALACWWGERHPVYSGERTIGYDSELSIALNKLFPDLAGGRQPILF